MPHAFCLRRGAHKTPNVRAVTAVAAVFFAALFGWRGSHARSPVAQPPLPASRLPHAGERLLVFSPHPDDETLGLGGYLHEARRRGAEVRVVFLTSGDGFQLCAAAKYRGWPNRRRMRQLAADREDEARLALSKLGISRDRLRFLGYPDRGLATLWQSNWAPETPYRSPYTGEAAVATTAGDHPPHPYCGVSVLRDAEAQLQDFRPDLILYPAGADDHPDHWATHCFVQLALERLRGAAWLERAERRTYLIHRGEWPQPLRTDRTLPITPPPSLAALETRWESVPLTRENIDAKASALHAYRSQEALTGNFLNAFLRRNELLVAGPPAAAGEGEALSGAVQPLGGYIRPGHWFPDSTFDRFARARCGAVDFSGLAVECGAAELSLSAELREPAAAWPAYYLYWKPVSGAPETLRTHRYRISGYRCDPPATRFAIDGRRLCVSIPWSELGGTSRIMVAASAWSGPLLLDRTAWQVVNVGDNRGLTAKTPRTPRGEARSF